VGAHQEYRADRSKRVDIGPPIPLSSGRMFRSEDQRELVTIFDEPDAVTDRVIALSREIDLSDLQLTPKAMVDRLRQVYGQENWADQHENSIHLAWGNSVGPANEGCAERGKGEANDPGLWHDAEGVVPVRALAVNRFGGGIQVFRTTSRSDWRASVIRNCGPVVTAVLAIQSGYVYHFTTFLFDKQEYSKSYKGELVWRNR
jgi:hypothetical protein